MTKIPIIIILICLISLGVNAQVDTLGVQDTLPKNISEILVEPKRNKVSFGQKIKEIPFRIRHFFHDEQPKPNKALLMSFILPGSGQAYNNKHWKIPIVYAGIGSISYLIAHNTKNYKRFKRAYIYRLDGDETTIEEMATRDLSNEALQNVRETYRKNLDRSYIGLAVFYAFVGIDAYIDAHMSSFDVSDDLSLDWKPVLEQNPMGTNVVGLGVVLKF